MGSPEYATAPQASLRSTISGDAIRSAEGGAQDILGGIGLRPSGYRVGMRPVEVAEAEGVVSNLRVVRRLLKIPSSFIQVNAAIAHC